MNQPSHAAQRMIYELEFLRDNNASMELLNELYAFNGIAGIHQYLTGYINRRIQQLQQEPQQ